MNVEEIRECLYAALPLRIPMYDPHEPLPGKIHLLEEYMRQTAYRRAELEEALHWAWEAKKTLDEMWTGVHGWEPMAGKSPTQPQIDSAKRVINPDIWSGLVEVRGLMNSLERQIKRLDRDGEVSSRAFSMLT